MQNTDSVLVLLGAAVVVAIVFAAFVVFYVSVLRFWIRAKMSGGRVSVFEILGMQFRGNPPSLLVDAYVALLMQGVETSIGDVERTYIAHRTQVADAADLARIVRAGARST
jgi:uncharacterized protein YqfA (UPF0365 family)